MVGTESTTVDWSWAGYCHRGRSGGRAGAHGWGARSAAPGEGGVWGGSDEWEEVEAVAAAAAAEEEGPGAAEEGEA